MSAYAMSAANRPLRFPVEPRLVPSEEDRAATPGIALSVFLEKRCQLEAEGFPEPHPIPGNYSLQAVDMWIDAQTGSTPVGGLVSDPSVIESRIRTKAWAK